jgi:hypothetical protein
MVRPVMRTILSERYAPITSSPGYLNLALDEAADALIAWRRRLGKAVKVAAGSEPFPEVLRLLEPLTGAVTPRELLVEVTGGWTAYFDCGFRGTDAFPPVSYLAEAVGCLGLTISATPHMVDPDNGGEGRLGAVQFALFGAARTHFLNYIRVVEVVHDGTRWTFHQSGAEQPFEESDAYANSRVRERFTSEMLERYCRAVGVDAFNSAAYGPRSILVTSEIAAPPGDIVKSLGEVQRLLGIRPGAADSIVG